MALLPILTYPDPRLKRMSEPVAAVTDETRRLIDDMFETMYDASGVGLAAPQVDVTQRVIVMDCGARDAEEEDDEDAPLQPVEPLALINPEIIAKEGKVMWPEGCLSVPDFTEDVERAERITVRALDRNGETIELDADGLLSVCIQHELDHLDGILFVDRISRLKQQMFKKRLKKQKQQEALA